VPTPSCSTFNPVIGPEATVSAKLNESIQPAVSKIKEVDQSRGISSRASDYYAKALNTSVGQKCVVTPEAGRRGDTS
jgi:hypothetical protein